MKAAVLIERRKPLVIEDRPIPQPGPKEVLVRVIGAGICHTDLHIIDGAFPALPLPRILGHEIAGEAENLGPVLAYPCWGCRRCEYCRGRSNFAATPRSQDGSAMAAMRSGFLFLRAAPRRTAVDRRGNRPRGRQRSAGSSETWACYGTRRPSSRYGIRDLREPLPRSLIEDKTDRPARRLLSPRRALPVSRGWGYNARPAVGV
jgi:Alcohol dehydrogenase GroES-like domain